MTRLVGGVAGGRRLAVPAGRGTRPTAERVREALFSALEAMTGTLAGRGFLDLYAGSGAVGLEAASRGAAPVLLVERDPAAARVARTNIETLGLPGVTLRQASVGTVLAEPPPATFDACFLDPPYADDVTGALEALLGGGWLAGRAVVVVERAARGPALRWPAGLVADRERRYGDTMLWYGRRS